MWQRTWANAVSTSDCFLPSQVLYWEEIFTEWYCSVERRGIGVTNKWQSENVNGISKNSQCKINHHPLSRECWIEKCAQCSTEMIWNGWSTYRITASLLSRVKCNFQIPHSTFQLLPLKKGWSTKKQSNKKDLRVAQWVFEVFEKFSSRTNSGLQVLSKKCNHKNQIQTHGWKGKV